MIDHLGRPVTEALPSQSVQLLGVRQLASENSSSFSTSFFGSSSIPGQAQELITVDSEARAKQIADRRSRMDELRRAAEAEQQFQAILQKQAAEAAKRAEALPPGDLIRR